MLPSIRMHVSFQIKSFLWVDAQNLELQDPMVTIFSSIQLNIEKTTQSKMSWRPKQIVLQKRHTDGQQAHEKKLNVTNYHRNAAPQQLFPHWAFWERERRRPRDAQNPFCLCPLQVPLPPWASPPPASSPASSARSRCAFWWLDWMLLARRPFCTNWS